MSKFIIYCPIYTIPFMEENYNDNDLLNEYLEIYYETTFEIEEKNLENIFHKNFMFNDIPFNAIKLSNHNCKHVLKHHNIIYDVKENKYYLIVHPSNYYIFGGRLINIK